MDGIVHVVCWTHVRFLSLCRCWRISGRCFSIFDWPRCAALFSIGAIAIWYLGCKSYRLFSDWADCWQTCSFAAASNWGRTLFNYRLAWRLYYIFSLWLRMCHTFKKRRLLLLRLLCRPERGWWTGTHIHWLVACSLFNRVKLSESLAKPIFMRPRAYSSALMCSLLQTNKLRFKWYSTKSVLCIFETTNICNWLEKSSSNKAI